MFTRIHIIINPAAGADEPILSYLNHILTPKGIDWEVSVTRHPKDAFHMAKEAMRKNTQLVAVYGGDGTVMEVAQALYQQTTPMAVIPGGTANVMAKEMNIPQDTQEAIKMLTRKPHIKAVDMGLMNDTPFLIRINVGVLADIVHDTSRSLKNIWGRLAYTISAVKHIAKPKQTTYTIKTDGETYTADGVCMLISNSGNVGLSDISLVPSIRMDDGKLDIVVLKNTDFFGLTELAQTTLLQQKPQEHLMHWKIKKAVIHIHPKQTVVHDDVTIKTNELHIDTVPHALRILVP